jgi:hypothetical protein
VARGGPLGIEGGAPAAEAGVAPAVATAAPAAAAPAAATPAGRALIPRLPGERNAFTNASAVEYLSSGARARPFIRTVSTPSDRLGLIERGTGIGWT